MGLEINSIVPKNPEQKMCESYNNSRKLCKTFFYLHIYL